MQRTWVGYKSEGTCKKPYTYITLHYSCYSIVKRCRDGGLYIYLHLIILACLHTFGLVINPYIL